MEDWKRRQVNGKCSTKKGIWKEKLKETEGAESVLSTCFSDLSCASGLSCVFKWNIHHFGLRTAQLTNPGGEKGFGRNFVDF